MRASNAACRFFKRGPLQRICSESRNAGEPRQHQWCGRDSAQCRAGGRRRDYGINGATVQNKH
jgi:hypothetical protein